MDANNPIVQLIAILAAALPGLIALYWQIRKDKKMLPQQTMDSGIRASKEAIEIISKYTEELKEMRCEVLDLRDKVDKLQKEIIEKDEILAEWSSGIKRLISQVISLDRNPVWEPKTRPIKRD